MLMVLNCSVPTEVSDEDFDFLSGLIFYLNESGYLVCTSSKYKGWRLHQIVAERMNLICPRDTDHKDTIKLNNTRTNLRPATRSQNMANTSIRSTNTSGYKNVSFHSKTGKWRARIMVGGKEIALGLHETPEQASNAAIQAAKKYFGDFANAG